MRQVAKHGQTQSGFDKFSNLSFNIECPVSAAKVWAPLFAPDAALSSHCMFGFAARWSQQLRSSPNDPSLRVQVNLEDLISQVKRYSPKQPFEQSEANSHFEPRADQLNK